MKLFALFAFAAIAVAHSAPEDSAVAENFVQSAPEFVESQDDDYNMSAENLLAELNGKSWKSLEAEFNQLIQNEDSDTQMATLFSFQKMAKMDPEELGQLTMDAMHKDQSAELEQMYAAPKAKSEQSDMVATDAKMESRTGWHRWRPHAHIPHRWRPVRQITRAVRHVGRWAARAARAVGGVIVSAVKRLGAYLKRLAAKLCRKVLRKVVKKVHKYVRRHVTRFCIKLCIKAAGKVYLLGGGSPAAGAVAAAIGAGCKIGCKLAFKALVKFIRHRYLSGAKMDVFVADYVCDSVGLKSEELVAIEDHSDEQWGFIKKRIKKRIKNFVKKSKKHFSRSKIHQYYKKYLSKYSKSRKKLKSWLKKRKMKGLVAIEDESDDESDVGFSKSYWKNFRSSMRTEEKRMKNCEAKQKESEECQQCGVTMTTNCHTGQTRRFNSNGAQIRPCPATCTCPETFVRHGITGVRFTGFTGCSERSSDWYKARADALESLARFK